jgi:hypothetical protein
MEETISTGTLGINISPPVGFVTGANVDTALSVYMNVLAGLETNVRVLRHSGCHIWAGDGPFAKVFLGQILAVQLRLPDSSIERQRVIAGALGENSAAGK